MNEKERERKGVTSSSLDTIHKQPFREVREVGGIYKTQTTFKILKDNI